MYNYNYNYNHNYNYNYIYKYIFNSAFKFKIRDFLSAWYPAGYFFMWQCWCVSFLFLCAGTHKGHKQMQSESLEGDERDMVENESNFQLAWESKFRLKIEKQMLWSESV